MTRRDLLTAGGLGFASLALGQTPPSKGDELLPGPTLDYQAMRALGYASVGGADVRECLQAIQRVDATNLDTWYDAFHALAAQTEAEAEKGSPRTRAEASARASMYHRSAYFFLTGTPGDPRLLESYEASVNAFRRALPVLLPGSEAVEIPYEGTTLDGYWLRGDGEGKRPLLIAHTGFDGTVEEICFCVRAALDRGWDVLAFDGPGQGAALRKRGLTFRPDWEKVVTPVVDFAERDGRSDLANLALIGYSFGGYLAPRAAAFEPRIKQLIANGGVLSMYDVVAGNMPPAVVQMAFDQPQAFDEGVAEYLKSDLGARWAFGNGIVAFGAKDAADWIVKLKPYTLVGVAEKIRARTLVVDSTDDTSMPGQSKKLFAALTCEKEMLSFDAATSADWHCQVGAQMLASGRIFDWLRS